MKFPGRRALPAITALLLFGVACGKGRSDERAKAAREAKQVAEVERAIAQFRKAVQEGRLEEAKRFVGAKKLSAWGPGFSSMAKDLAERDMSLVKLKVEGDRVKLYQEQEGMLGPGKVTVSVYLNIAFAKEDGQWKWVD